MTANAAWNSAANVGHDCRQQMDLVGISHTDAATACAIEILELPTPEALSRMSMIFQGKKGENTRDRERICA